MFRLSQIAVPVLGAVVLAGVGGCTHERHAEIPATAAEVSTGTMAVSATATHAGDVYIYDASSDKMIYTGQVKAGQMVKVEAEQNRVTLDGRTLTERDLPNDHQYKIFFDSNAAAMQPAAMQPAVPAAQSQQPATYQPAQPAPAKQTTPTQTTPAPARSY